MAARQRPLVKAGTDGKRIVLWFKTGDRDAFSDLLSRVRAMPGAKFDWDEKVWHMPLTGPNAKRVAHLDQVTVIEIAPMLGAWIADHSITERMDALEAEVEHLRKVISQLGIDPRGESR